MLESWLGSCPEYELMVHSERDAAMCLLCRGGLQEEEPYCQSRSLGCSHFVCTLEGTKAGIKVAGARTKENQTSWPCKHNSLVCFQGHKLAAAFVVTHMTTGKTSGVIRQNDGINSAPYLWATQLLPQATHLETMHLLWPPSRFLKRQSISFFTAIEKNVRLR